MSSLSEDIKAGIKSVGGEWKRAKKASNKKDRVSHSRMSYMRTYHRRETTLKEAAFQFMEQAYNKASSNGKFYANARQIMYAARPLIIEVIGADKWDNNSSPVYFQTLLKDYIERHGGLKVVWDARGHLKEPHTEHEIGLGGAEVMKYQSDRTGSGIELEPPIEYTRVNTTGPVNRYGAILFIEKEGFDIQLDDVEISKKWDIAIMSSKGIPNAATCNVGAFAGVPVLALHDFDLAGFKIVRTLRNGARLSNGISDLIDIGLRLEDVTDLTPEPDFHSRAEAYLRSCGATSAEIAFLANQRVELNMFTTEQLIEFLERKFTEHGIKKIVPTEAILHDAYKRAIFYRELIKKSEEIEQKDLTIPENLTEQITDSLKDDPLQSWDDAIWDLVEDEEA